ncbi:MAG: sugar ABC transporter permease [Desulfobacterales bacterium]|nr:MAG: sugar ABC transporter permease [Desulfobacterales bacterium]
MASFAKIKWRRILLDKGTGALFLTPALILLLVLLVGPFSYMVGLSFTDLSFSQPDRDGNFVGFTNYRKLMQDDPIFWESFLTTIKFVFAAVSLEFLFGLCLALLLFHLVGGQRFIVTLILMPMMLAPVAIGLMWKLLLNGEFGMLTYYLRQIDLMAAQTAPLSSYDLVLWTMVGIDVWEWTPFVTLVILAGLMSLPKEPFEAAIMDGAKPLRVFWDVTLTLLRPIIALVMLLRGIDAFKEFDKVFILTGGGPGTATELLSIYTWRINFRNWDFGYGSVVAFMVYLVVLIMCSVFYKAITWKQGMEEIRA